MREIFGVLLDELVKDNDLTMLDEVLATLDARESKILALRRLSVGWRRACFLASMICSARSRSLVLRLERLPV